MQMSQLAILYSFKIILIVSSSKSGLSTVLVIDMPPLDFILNEIFGGSLLSLIPNPSSSFSIISLCFNGFVASKTMQIKLHVRATAITCLPRPFPSLAPSIIPGKSNNYIFAPLILIFIIIIKKIFFNY